MRKQYHFRNSPQGLLARDVDRPVERSGDFARETLKLTGIRELDEPFWSNDGPQMTCRKVVEHVRLIHDADLAFPVILSSDGRVMDGMHRICKALLQGKDHVEAVRFYHDPQPDYIGVKPDDLPYSDD